MRRRIMTWFFVEFGACITILVTKCRLLMPAFSTYVYYRVTSLLRYRHWRISLQQYRAIFSRDHARLLSWLFELSMDIDALPPSIDISFRFFFIYLSHRGRHKAYIARLLCISTSVRCCALQSPTMHYSIPLSFSRCKFSYSSLVGVFAFSVANTSRSTNELLHSKFCQDIHFR